MSDTTYYYNNALHADNIVSNGSETIYKNALITWSKQLNYITLPDIDLHFLLLIFFSILWLYLFLKRKFFGGNKSSNADNQQGYPSDNEESIHYDDTSVKDYFIYHGKDLNISEAEIKEALQKYIPYYRQLEPYLKQRFEKRVMRFMTSKDFIIHSEEGFKEMPVLVSAAFVQISFGLDEYLLPWYKYIQIYKEEYFADNSFRVLAGHVQGETVTLAWNHLLKGFDSPDDGANVALHEMAHALYYQHIVADTGSEKDFKHHFNEIMQEGEDVYAQRAGRQILFSDYAYKDLQEFWAESVEIFFEKPEQMQLCYPELFEIMKELLKQNPCNKSNPLNIDL